MSRTFSLLALAGAVVVAATPAFAQGQDRVKELIQQALAQQGQPAPVAAGQPTGPVVNLTEDEAVTRATERNLNIAAERITPQTWDFSLAATRAFYAPTLTSALQHQDRNTPQSNAFSGGARTLATTQNWSGGLTQNIWKGGGNYNLNWDNNHDETNSTNSTCNPCYTSRLTAAFTQPLLRNRKIDSTRATIRTNQISQDIAELNLSSTVASILAETRNAYWELVYAYQAVEAAQSSLGLASKLVQDNRSRVEIGTMAPIDIVQAQAEEATRRQQLVSAQAILRNNELALKRLIVSGTDDDLWRATIVPSGRPVATPTSIDLEEAVRNALSRRTDLSAAKKDIEATDITLQSLQNQIMPGLNLIANLNLQGQAGVSRPLNDPITGQLITPPAGTYWTTLERIGTFNAPTWSIRLAFDYPLGTSAAKANHARQRLIRRQSETSLKTIELQIATEVTSAALAVRNSLEALQAAGVARELSERREEAARSKYDVGMATNFEVVQAQRDLVDARNRELREQLNYQRALVDFQRVQVSPR